MPKFSIPVTRIGYAVRNIEVEAANEAEARRIALEAARDREFHEHDAEYAITSSSTETDAIPESKQKREAIQELLLAAKCALADLEGIMPEYEPSGDRTYPGWKTIRELRKAIKAMKRAGYQ